jgi:hypothetical protein
MTTSAETGPCEAIETATRPNSFATRGPLK